MCHITWARRVCNDSMVLRIAWADCPQEQLIEAFKTVGQVVGFRLVFDRDTGKPKGYGFCEFADHDTAQSAVRNLNGQEIGGRPLRIDLADSDPFLEGKTTIRGELVDAGETRSQWRERERDFGGGRGGGGGGGGGARHTSTKGDPNAFLAKVPRGVPVPPGSTSLDTISTVLAREDPPKILEVLAQMKAFVITHPELAKALLVAHPQLGYALFQALLLNKIVDPTVLNRMLAATASTSAPPVASVISSQPPYPQPVHHPPPDPRFHPPPASTSYAPPPPNPHMPPPAQLPPYYGRPPPGPPVLQQQNVPPPQPPQPAATTQAPANTAGYGAAQRDMLAQVLALTPEQINSLPPMERDQIIQLRKSLGMPA
ncbi:hypothetical protein BXZ70DRAFT_906328 [Cristinia sonorae]|uniref:RRM domain-containing protein n=1 Tax=Cristinia sonorae TaxID=1940300 RepID=A0A8K0XQV7_9AGAR|nr:hypothetical protein BXZ70DRAFT_906328 [Cristinia sonorae]